MVLQKQAADRRFELSEVDGEPISAKVHEPRLTHRFGTEPGKSWRPPGAVLPSSSSTGWLDFFQGGRRMWDCCCHGGTVCV